MSSSNKGDAIILQSVCNTIALNGIITLAGVMRDKGILDSEGVERLYRNMTKPLDIPDLAENTGAHQMHGLLDRLFVGLQRD